MDDLAEKLKVDVNEFASCGRALHELVRVTCC